jgi:hypothetical protein
MSAVERRADQARAVVEVVVEQWRRDAGAACDLVDPQPPDPFLGDHRSRNPQDGLPAALGHRSATVVGTGRHRQVIVCAAIERAARVQRGWLP